MRLFNLLLEFYSKRIRRTWSILKDDLGFVSSVSVSLALAWQYFVKIEEPNYVSRTLLQENILSSTAESPFRYRILIPTVNAWLNSLFEIALTEKQSFLISHFVMNAVIFFLYFYFSYLLFRFHINEMLALLGIYVLGFAFLITMQSHYYQPWSYLEGLFWVLSLWAITQSKFLLIALVVVLASLNRETGIFIPILLACMADEFQRPKKQALVFSMILGLQSIAILVTLRYWKGSDYSNFRIIEFLNLNLVPGNLMLFFIYLFLVFGFNWVLIIRTGRLDLFWSRACRVLLVYLPFISLFSIWSEVRVLIPSFTLFTACLLSSMRTKTQHKSDQRDVKTKN